MQDFSLLANFESLLYLEIGIGFVFISPLIIIIAQMALAVREIALNSRKDDHPSSDTQYKILESVAFIVFLGGCVLFVLGAVLIFKYI